MAEGYLLCPYGCEGSKTTAAVHSWYCPARLPSSYQSGTSADYQRGLEQGRAERDEDWMVALLDALVGAGFDAPLRLSGDGIGMCAERLAKSLCEQREQSRQTTRAETLAAAIALLAKLWRMGNPDGMTDEGQKLWFSLQTGGNEFNEQAAMKMLQPASDALAALLEQAHEAALPLASESIIKAITEGVEFSPESPLSKVKGALDAAKLEFGERVRESCRELDTVSELAQQDIDTLDLRELLKEGK